MRICILTEYLSYIGGGERVYCSWANMFAEKLGHDVTIASMEQWDKPFYVLSSKVKVVSLGLRPAKFYQNPRKRKLSMITHFMSDRRHIQRYLQSENFDLVLGIAVNINLILATVTIPSITVATEHNEYYAPKLYLRLVRNVLYKRFKALTVLNYDDEKAFKRIVPSTRTMLNPVEFDRSHKKENVLQDKRLISIASLSVKKNQRQMLDAMKIIHQRHPDWELTIHGEGPLRKELETYAGQIGVSEYVHFPGVTNDVYGKLGEASIFLLTSSIEGFGLVIVEAMSAGLPCVCFDALGPKMIIEDGVNGYLVPIGDVSMFADKVCKLIEDCELRKRMGKSASESVQKYSTDNVAREWDKFFTLLKS